MYKGKTILDIVEDQDNPPAFILKFTDGTSLNMSVTMDVEDEYNDYDERLVILGLLIQQQGNKTSENATMLFTDHNTWIGRY